MDKYEKNMAPFNIDEEMKSKFGKASGGINRPIARIESLAVETVIVDREGKI